MCAARFILCSSLLLRLATAVDWTFDAGFSTWVTHHHTFARDSMEKAYTACQEYDANAQSIASGAACIHHSVALILQSFSVAFAGGYLGEILASGIEQSSDYHEALLDHFNKRSAPNGLRATRVLDSHIHPHDGVAIRMNVYGNKSAMHLHTNGSHAMVLFDKENDLQRRGYLDIKGHYFRFSGVDGFKAQAHGINHPSVEAWGDDIDDFAGHWTEARRRSEAFLRQADTWTFEACNEKRTASFYYGVLSVESGRPAGTYELVDPPGCHWKN